MKAPLSEQVKQRLLSAILAGQYGPEGLLPTIRDLARRLKVSTNTVQKAIHQLSSEGVVEARPGRGIVVKSVGRPPGGSRLVGVPLPYDRLEPLRRDRGWPHGVLIPLRDRLAEAGYSAVFCPLLNVDELAVVEHLRGLNLAGIVLFEVYNDHLVTEIAALRLPMVSMDYDTSHLGIPSVVFDNAWGGFQAARHLIDHGHRHIVSLHPRHRRRVGRNPFLDAVDKERVEGFRLAMMSAGLAVRLEDFTLVTDSPAGEAVGESGVLQERLAALFETQPVPTALMCRNDGIARIVAEHLRELALRVPEDVSIIGFGDAAMEFSPGKRLTSIWVDRDGMGRTAAQYILREMKQRTPVPHRHVLPTHVAGYDSVADLRRAAVHSATRPGAG
jgi:DNA-binding LacI/PurR family transcriptional regulator